MYRVMIVDDEKVFRDGLQQNIDWLGNGLEVVAEAQNGREALSMLDSARPDVILTDILMPEMDGLELAEHIRLTHPQIKVIMLTVMDGFSEMQRSLRAQVTDYVLKFNYKEETLPAVCKACQMLERERIILSETSNMHYAAVSFLRECILGNLSSSETAKLLRTDHEELMDMRCTVLLAALPDLTLREETALYLALQWEVKELRMPETKSYIVSLGSRSCLVLFQRRMEEGEMMRHGRTILRRMRRKNPAYRALRVGVGGMKDDPALLMEAYGEAELALSMTELTDTDLLFQFNLQGDRSSYQILMQRAAEYIDENYASSAFGLKDVSERFYLSPSYFSTVFKRAFGMGFNEYLTIVRLNHAKNLLESSALKTYEIAERVGYASPQYMSILFKRHFGCSPGEYRRLHGGAPDQPDS